MAIYAKITTMSLSENEWVAEQRRLQVLLDTTKVYEQLPQLGPSFHDPYHIDDSPNYYRSNLWDGVRLSMKSEPYELVGRAVFNKKIVKQITVLIQRYFKNPKLYTLNARFSVNWSDNDFEGPSGKAHHQVPDVSFYVPTVEGDYYSLGLEGRLRDQLTGLHQLGFEEGECRNCRHLASRTCHPDYRPRSTYTEPEIGQGRLLTFEERLAAYNRERQRIPRHMQ